MRLYISFIFLCLSVVLSAQNSLYGKVSISEVYYDTYLNEDPDVALNRHFGEFIELFNSSTEDIDISGWRLNDNVSTYYFPSGTIIASGGFKVIAYSNSTSLTTSDFIALFPEASGHDSDILLQSVLVLNNKFDAISLRTNTGELLQTIRYGNWYRCPNVNSCQFVTTGIDNSNTGVLGSAISDKSKLGFYQSNVNDYYGYEGSSFNNGSYQKTIVHPFALSINVPLLPLVPEIVIVENNDGNWIHSDAYDFNGTRIGAGRNYFNFLGKQSQSLSYDVKENKMWASNTLYDSHGRAALQTLSAPVKEGYNFSMHEYFIRNATGDEYSISDFDSGSTIDNPSIVGNTSTSPLGFYYSSNNTENPYQDVTSYPFSRTVFSKLNPGAVKKTLGGNKINGEWLQGYSFSMPAAQELATNVAFGSSSYNTMRITKTIGRDVNGVETVVFTDSDGNTLAAARSGNEENSSTPTYAMTSTIKEQGFIDVHIPVGCSGLTITNTTGQGLTIFDLVTEQIVYTTPSSISSGFYRIAVNDIDNYTYDVNNSISIDYNINYYDYSLNTFDKAGRLLSSSQPLGTDITSIFKYNSLGQLLSTTSPDEGEARFVYRKDGQIRFSRNSKQKEDKEFSYTHYDEFGRPIESGVFDLSDDLLNYNPVVYTNTSSEYFGWFSDELLAIVDDSNKFLLPGPLYSISTKEMHHTFYDTPDASLESILITNNIPIDSYKQTFVSGNVSKTFTSDPTTSTTWYSYDVFGKVRFIIQDIPGVGLKTIDYEYDFATNRVVAVDYQRHNASERLIHYYEYNVAGQLIRVSTSTDDVVYTEQAEYFYNEKGSLKRTELAEDLQGIDYVYNLNGQLKAINSPQSIDFTDPGNDSPATNGFKTDVFGMIIDYHSSDFQRNNSTIYQGLKNNSTNNQFNGNIGSIRWNNDTPAATANIDTYKYNYNKNNWLSSASYGTSTANNPVTFAQDSNDDYEVSNVTYDANGNIQTLKRNGVTDANGNNAMDEFTYHYKDGKNQLEAVQDNNDNADAIRFDDLKDQYAANTNNYVYNSIGQLETNLQDQISYDYNASGLVSKINTFSQSNTNTWATIFYQDYYKATNAAVIPWNLNSGIAEVNNGFYQLEEDLNCDYLYDTYRASLRLRLSGNKTASRTLTTLPNVLHTIDIDVIALQTKLKLTGNTTIYPQIPIGYHLRIKTASGTVLASTTVNPNLDFIDDPDIPGGTGGFILPCDYFYDEHINLSFTATSEDTILEIEAFNSDPKAMLYLDNIQIQAATTPKLAFYYNDRGQRVRKEAYQDQNTDITYYVRDAAGSVMAIYTEHISPTNAIALALKEQPVYGANRIGVLYRDNSNSEGGVFAYQLTDHLGNVRAVVIKDGNNAISLTNKTDYYPFGMPMPGRNIVGGYRYGYQGEYAEKDEETGLNAFQLRMYDSRIGRWISPDPYGQFNSPYLAMDNRPNMLVDPDGGCTVGVDCPKDFDWMEKGTIVLDEVVIGGGNGVPWETGSISAGGMFDFSFGSASQWQDLFQDGLLQNGYLSDHLRISDITRSSTAKKLGINNAPTADALYNLKAYGENIYDPIYENFNGNLKISSGYRNPILNNAVGGSTTSQHMLGQAVDIQGIKGVTNADIFNYTRKNLTYHQMIWEFGNEKNPNWVHIGYKRSNNAMKLTRAIKNSRGKTVYIPYK